MIITLDELNRCRAALPDPQIARTENRTQWRVAIEPDMPVRPLYNEPDPIGPTIRVATFELKKVEHFGAVVWRWTPCDEIIM